MTVEIELPGAPGGGRTVVGAEYAQHVRDTAASIEQQYPEGSTHPSAAAMRAHAANLRRSLEGVAPAVPVDERSPGQLAHDRRHGVEKIPAAELAHIEVPRGYDGTPERAQLVRQFAGNLGGNVPMARALIADLLRGGDPADPAQVAALLPPGWTYEAATAAAQIAIDHAGATGTVNVGDFSAGGLGMLAAYGRHLARWRSSRPS